MRVSDSVEYLRLFARVNNVLPDVLVNEYRNKGVGITSTTPADQVYNSTIPLQFYINNMWAFCALYILKFLRNYLRG